MNSKISVVTITFNSEQYLEETIKSVLNQKYHNIEYIIVDGGSTDGTLEIIEKYSESIEKIVSGPDKGIADAMNKGLALATGDFVIFLHSDDYFLDSTSLAEAVKYLRGDVDIFLFDIILLDKKHKRLAKPRGLNWWINFKTGVFHQSAICSRALFERIGNFDTSLKIVMDYDFFLRAYRSDVKYKKIDFPLSVMRMSGISSQLDRGSLGVRFGEEMRIHRKNCSNLLLRILYRVYWPFYLSYRKVLNFRRPDASP